MKNAKLILMIIGVLIAAVIAWTLVGVVVTVVKFLFVLALILLAVVVISKLSKKREPAQLEENRADNELNEAIRQLEELKRKHLIK
jgi:membrane protein implicated in regulation of membrane protease activity